MPSLSKVFSSLVLSSLLAQAVYAANTFPSSGNVGIGTTNPRLSLDLHYGSLSVGNEGSFLGFNTYNDGGWRAKFAGKSGFIRLESDGRLQFFTATSTASGTGNWLGGVNEALSITPAGNIGINMPNPSDTLYVHDTGGNAVLTLDGQGSGDWNGGMLRIYAGDLNSGQVFGSVQIRMDNAANGEGSLRFERRTVNDDTRGTIYSYTDRNGHAFATPNWMTQTGVTERMRITTGGDIGIGTQNPAADLAIVNTRPHLSLGSPSSQNGVRFEYHEVDEALRLQASNQNGGSGSGVIVAFERSGNVGIGTTSPDNKLDVKGTIRAEEIIVETGWADYVFEEDYRLAPLSEVEAHIEKKGHLPGIPSAAEIQENGAKLSELVTLQMAKIEELTLHLIEKEKQLMSANSEIEDLTMNLADLRRSNSDQSLQLSSILSRLENLEK